MAALNSCSFIFSLSEEDKYEMQLKKKKKKVSENIWLTKHHHWKLHYHLFFSQKPLA